MTFITIEEQLEYLRAPGAPTAVDVWLEDGFFESRTEITRYNEQGLIEEWATRPSVLQKTKKEARRALRERAFWEWYSNVKDGWSKQGPEFHSCAVDPHSRKIVSLESSSSLSVRLRGDEIARLSRLEMDRVQAARAAYDHLFLQDSNTQKQEH